MWAAQYYDLEQPRRLTHGGGLGTMGFGLPAAIGAQVGEPDVEVWAIVGDGGFQMSLHELPTLVQEGTRSRSRIINNGYLGMVRQWQDSSTSATTPRRLISSPTSSCSRRRTASPPAASTHAEVDEAIRWAQETTAPC